MHAAPLDDDALDDLLDQRFEVERGTIRTRDASVDEIRQALSRLSATLAGQVAKLADRIDEDARGHLAPRVAVLVGQIGELRVALAWATARQHSAEHRWADYLPREWRAA